MGDVLWEFHYKWFWIGSEEILSARNKNILPSRMERNVLRACTFWPWKAHHLWEEIMTFPFDILTLLVTGVDESAFTKT